MKTELELEAEKYVWKVKRNKFSDPVKEGESEISVSYWEKDTHITDVKEQKAFVFTEEQLNELLSSVIRETLNVAAENAAMKEYKQGDWDICWISNDMGDAYVLYKQSILNQFDNVFNKVKV